MVQAAKYILLAFLALLVVTLIGYTDCRLHGDNPDKCRLVFQGAKDFIYKVEGNEIKDKPASMICSPTFSPTLICPQPSKDKLK